MRISPRGRRLGFWGWTLSGFLLRLGRPDEALHEARTAAGRDAHLHLARLTEASALQALGRSAEAAEAAAALAALAAARRLRPARSLDEVARVAGRRVASQLAPLWPSGASRAAGR